MISAVEAKQISDDALKNYVKTHGENMLERIEDGIKDAANREQRYLEVVLLKEYRNRVSLYEYVKEKLVAVGYTVTKLNVDDEFSVDWAVPNMNMEG